jgi:hypothetical protein
MTSIKTLGIMLINDIREGGLYLPLYLIIFCELFLCNSL